MMKKYLVLTSKIDEELLEIGKLAERALKAWDLACGKNDDLYLDSVALNLHGFYTGIEKIFEMIAKNIDGSVPVEDSWHMELLKQMAMEIQQLRPRVIRKETLSLLNDYRGFRHIVRNIYTYHISIGKLAPLMEELPRTLSLLNEDLHEITSLLIASSENQD
jgi:hypothetical protein